ncbi:MAG: VWA domain-containing protein [Gammaproteobacteria bacterium]|nr:VWA domain-containing protein [Gammaproteobacteria bacterium]
MRTSADKISAGHILIFLLLAFAGIGASQASTPEKKDVRVLIDISGSMRQNDPENLRRPALRMLAGLLQPGTQAGVWTFARWVNNLVPVAEVDAAWKKRTQALSKQIASPGQFTNIEEVLDKASADWEGEPTTHARHLVLLTDGMVDISKQAAENARSRSRILDTLLPRLQAAGVQVHTIALSERADHDLMQRLAAETGGWYQQVAKAEELQRVFLRMFEKVGSPDTVPLEDNRFVVDGSVNEVTVVLFSKPDSPPAVLLSPSGESYKDSDLPAGIAWSRDQGYDMITIASPQKGEWVLQADVDPDNRVMIVTDLKLQTSEVPTHIAAGEQTRVEASLSNRGKLVARQAFLRLVDVRAEASGAGDARSLPLNDLGEAGDEKAGDGRYTMRFGEQQAGQEVELVVAVDSPTFMREKRFRLVVHEPVAVAVAESPDGPVLTADVQPAVMQPGAIVTAWQEDAGGKRVPLQLVQPEPGQWTVPLKDLVSSSYVNVSGTTRLGNLIEHTVGPLMLPGVELPPPVAEPPPVIEPVPEPVAPVAEAVAEVPAEPEVEEGGWLIPAIIFGVLNLTLLIGAGVWFFLMNRRGAESDELDLEQLIETQVSAPNAEESQPRENAA